MKNYLIGGLICLVAALVIGVVPIQRVINEGMNHGTLRGVETCMNYSSSELLSEDAIRATCVKTFQKRVYDRDLATGLAGPLVGQRTVSWAGSLQNKTLEHVTTWIKISVNIYDADGAEQNFDAETSIWIAPLGEAEFKVELPDLKPEQIDKTEFCDDDVSARSDCMGWGVVGVMGLEI